MTTTAYTTPTKRRIAELLFALATMALGAVAGWISIGFIVRGTELANSDPIIRELATQRGVLFCVAASALAFIHRVMSGTSWTLSRIMMTGFLGFLAVYNLCSIIVVQVTAAESNNSQAMASSSTVGELERQLKLKQDQASALTQNAGAITSTSGKALTQHEELYMRTLARQAAARAAIAASDADATLRQLQAARAAHHGPTFATSLCRTTDTVIGDSKCTVATYYQYGYEIVGGLILDLISVVCWGWAGSLLRREIEVEAAQGTSTGLIGRMLRAAGRKLRIGAAAGATAAAALSSPAQANEPPSTPDQQQGQQQGQTQNAQKHDADNAKRDELNAKRDELKELERNAEELEQIKKMGEHAQNVHPCPACNSTRKVNVKHKEFTLADGDKRHLMNLVCDDCGHSPDYGKAISIKPSDLPDTEHAALLTAIGRWNAATAHVQNSDGGKTAHVQYDEGEKTAHVQQHESGIDAAIAAQRQRIADAAAAIEAAKVQQEHTKREELEALTRQAAALQQQQQQLAEQQQDTAASAVTAEAEATEAEALATANKKPRRKPIADVKGMPDTGTSDADGTRYRSVVDAVMAGQIRPTEADITKHAQAGRPTALRYIAAMLQAGVIKPRAKGKGYELA